MRASILATWLWCTASAVHVAFVAPPFSHYAPRGQSLENVPALFFRRPHLPPTASVSFLRVLISSQRKTQPKSRIRTPSSLLEGGIRSQGLFQLRPMLPIAHGLLDEGHSVSFLAHDETVKKIKSLGRETHTAMQVEFQSCTGGSPPSKGPREVPERSRAGGCGQQIERGKETRSANVSTNSSTSKRRKVAQLRMLVPQATLVDIGSSGFDREKGAPVQMLCCRFVPELGECVSENSLNLSALCPAREALQTVSYGVAQFLSSLTMPLLGSLLGGDKGGLRLQHAYFEKHKWRWHCAHNDMSSNVFTCFRLCSQMFRSSGFIPNEEEDKEG